jgi:hypothetical protein
MNVGKIAVRLIVLPQKVPPLLREGFVLEGPQKTI